MNSTKSSKCLLNQYCQRNKLKMPIYLTEKVSDIKNNTDNKDEWQSALTLYLQNGESITIIGSITSTKISTEESAAKLGLEELKNSEVCLVPLPSNNFVIEKKSLNAFSAVLLVDVENLPTIIDDMPSFVINKYNIFDIYAFVGKYHHSADRVFNKRVTKIFSPSTRKDGTDTCMQLYAGIFLSKETYEHYIIATKDHFGPVLVEMIKESSLLWKAKTAELITSHTQFLHV